LDDIRELERRLNTSSNQLEEKIHTIEVLSSQMKLHKDRLGSVEQENSRLQ
jgi:hypothetical protein